MNDSVRRTLRGLFQLTTAEILVRFMEAFFLDFTEDQHVAVLGVLTLLVTLGQNFLEDTVVSPQVRAVLKGAGTGTGDGGTPRG